MTYTRKLIQARPSKDIKFFAPGPAAINLVENYKSLGKILEYKSEMSENDIVNTITIKFANEDEYKNYFSKDIIAITSAQERYDYCMENCISFNIVIE